MHTSNLDSDSFIMMFKFKLPRRPVTASGIIIIIAFCRSACRALALPSMQLAGSIPATFSNLYAVT